MIKIDYSHLPTFFVTFEDGQVAQYNCACYHGATIGCFAYTMSGISVTGYIVEKGATTYKAVPAWEPTPDLYEAICKYYIQQAERATFVIMGDAINRGTPNKVPVEATIAAKPGMASVIFDTKKFVEYLIKHKVGTVYASPIGRNKNHPSPGNFSLCQAWIWVPPQSKDQVLPHSAAVFNEDDVTREKWAKSVSDTWLTSYSTYCKEKEYDWDYLVKNTMKKDSPLFARALDY